MSCPSSRFWEVLQEYNIEGLVGYHRKIGVRRMSITAYFGSDDMSFLLGLALILSLFSSLAR